MNHRKRSLTVVSAVAAAVFLSAIAQAQDIQTKRSAFVEGNRVKLGEVADISQVDDSQLEQLESVEIAASPPPGACKLIEPSYILMKLRQRGYDTDKINVTGGAIRATRSYAELTSEQLADQLEEYILYEMPWEPEDTSIELYPMRGKEILPAGDFNVVITRDPTYEFVGDGVFKATIYVNGKKYKTLNLKAHVEPYEEMVVAKKRIVRGEMLSRDNLTLEKRPISRTTRNGYFSSIDEVAGLSAVRTIISDKVVDEASVDKPIVVKRGKPVLVEIEKPSFRISVTAKALESGRVGDIIRVENVKSKERFTCVIAGPKKVVPL